MRTAVGDRRDDLDGAVRVDFHIQIVIGVGRRRAGRGLVPKAVAILHELLRALLVGAGKETLADPVQAAGDVQLFLELVDLGAQDGQSLNWRSSSAFSAIRPLEFLFEKRLVAFGGGEFLLGVGDLRFQIR